MKDEKFMTAAEAAKRLRISLKTMWRLLSERKIGRIQLGANRSVRISEEQFQEFLKTYEIEPYFKTSTKLETEDP